MKKFSLLLFIIGLCALAGLVIAGCGSSDEAKNATTAKSSGERQSKSGERHLKTKGNNSSQMPAPLPPGPPLEVHNQPIPILMYHVITQAPPNASFPELFVSKETFAAHMQALADHGFHAVTLEQAGSYWRKGTRLPEKPIVISFDDGYHSIYTNAFPVMRKLRWPGVLNLKVDNLKVAGGINEQQVRKLLRYGWELGAHTITHPDLTKVSPATLKQEVVDSRAILHKRFDTPVNTFCYPAGRYSDTVIRMVETAGYTSATTTELGYAKPERPFELARVRVNGSDDADALMGRLHNLSD